MINNLKLGFRTLKFAHAVKSTAILGVIIFILGEAMCLLDHWLPLNGGLPGGYFFMLVVLFMIQLLYSVNMSNLVQSSPVKKKLQTSVPATMSTFCMLTAYLLVLATEGFVAYKRPERIGIVCVHVVFTIIIMALIMLYTAVCYKYFFGGTILFFAVFFISYGYFMNGEGWLVRFQEYGWSAFARLGILGAAVLLAFGVLQYLLSLAVYRAPMSKRAQSASLRRQL